MSPHGRERADFYRHGILLLETMHNAKQLTVGRGCGHVQRVNTAARSGPVQFAVQYRRLPVSSLERGSVSSEGVLPPNGKLLRGSFSSTDHSVDVARDED